MRTYLYAMTILASVAGCYGDQTYFNRTTGDRVSERIDQAVTDSANASESQHPSDAANEVILNPDSITNQERLKFALQEMDIFGVPCRLTPGKKSYMVPGCQGDNELRLMPGITYNSLNAKTLSEAGFGISLAWNRYIIAPQADSQNQELYLAASNGSFVRIDESSGRAKNSSEFSGIVTLNAEQQKYEVSYAGGAREHYSLVGQYVDGQGISNSVYALTFETHDVFSRMTQYERDSQGRVVAIRHPNGQTTLLNYGSNNLLISIISAVGVETTLQYDVANQLTRINFPDATYIQLTYKSPTAQYRGLVSDIRYQDGHQFSFAYNGTSNDPGEATLKALVDRDDQRKTLFYYNNSQYAIKDTFMEAVEIYTFDANGRLVRSESQIQDAPRNVNAEYSWSDADQLTLLRTPTSASGFEYDQDGNLTGSTDHLGNRAEYSNFNPWGMPSQTIKGYANSDHTTRSVVAYDQLGRVTTTKVYPTGTGFSSTTQYQWSGNSQLSVTYPNGAVATTHFDAKGRKIAEMLNGKEMASYQYNIHGLVAYSDIQGRQVSIERDADGLPTRIESDRSQVNYQYDSETKKVQEVTSWRGINGSNVMALANTASFQVLPLEEIPQGEYVTFGEELTGDQLKITSESGSINPDDPSVRQPTAAQTTNVSGGPEQRNETSAGRDFNNLVNFCQKPIDLDPPNSCDTSPIANASAALFLMSPSTSTSPSPEVSGSPVATPPPPQCD